MAMDDQARKDALADAETLLWNIEPWTASLLYTHTHLLIPDLRIVSPRTTHHPAAMGARARGAASAAFRAVPGLRG